MSSNSLEPRSIVHKFLRFAEKSGTMRKGIGWRGMKIGPRWLLRQGRHCLYLHETLPVSKYFEY